MNTMPSRPVNPAGCAAMTSSFALALGKADQRHIMSRGEVVDVGDDLPRRWRN
jgi:hypothetical protein